MRFCRFNKYHVSPKKERTENNIVFDSKSEKERYLELLTLQKKEKIKGLHLQPKFLLQESFESNGEKHRPIYYTADFEYYLPDGTRVVEDVKGFKTDVYKLKKKLFLYRYGNLLTFKEVGK